MPYLCPPTLTAAEQKTILRITRDHPRDHAIISIALGTGLRLAEIVGLDVGDLFSPDGKPRSRVHIRAAIAKGGRAADVFLPEKLLPKLARLWAFKRQRTEILAPDAPVFCSQSGRRISKRRVQTAWSTWQASAGFDRRYSFHCLRHTAVTSLYRAARNLFLAQRFARHVSPLTTIVYTHPSDEELRRGVRSLDC